MARIKVVLALVLFAGLAASCGGGSSGDALAPTSTSKAATAERLPDLLSGAPIPAGLTALTFIDPQHGWALDTCSELNDFLVCEIVATSDGGITWQIQERHLGRLQSLQFLDARIGFAVSSLGQEIEILATTDGGATWSSRYGGRGLELSAVTFVTPERGFAIAPGSGTIFRTSDGGTTWVFAYGSPSCRFNALDFPATNEGWVGGDGVVGPCLHHTEDGGESWRAAFNGAESDSVADAIVDFVDPNGNRDDLPELIGHVNGNCGVGMVDFVDPANGWLVVGCRAHFSGGFAVMSSSDGGGTWQHVWGPSSCIMGCQMLTGGRGPVFFLDTDHVWRQGRNAIEKSADGGLTWTVGQEVGQNYDSYYGAFFVDPANGWVPTRDDDPPGTIRVTTDGGLTWAVQQITIEP